MKKILSVMNSKIFKFFFISFQLLIFIMLGLHAHATVYYVNDNSTSGDVFCTAVGNNANNGTSAATPKLTVAAVISTYVLAAGDEVRIDAGTYDLTAAITITSADAGNASGMVTFAGAGKNLTTIKTSASNIRLFYLNGVNYIEMKDMKIYTQYTSSTNPAVYIYGNSDNNKIHDCIIENASITPFAIELAPNGTAVGDNNEIYLNTIQSERFGIKIYGYSTSPYAYPSSNKIYQNKIDIIDPDGTPSNHGDTYQAIKLDYTSSTEIKQNKISGATQTIFLYRKNTSINIYNNYIFNNNSNDVLCMIHIDGAGNGGNIYFNSFYITGGDTWDQTIMHFVYANSQSGFNVKNNIFFNNSPASSSDGWSNYVLYRPDASTFASMDYNLYYVPNGALIAGDDDTWMNYITVSDWQSVDHDSNAGTYGDENSIEGDPFYSNASIGNLDLLTGSIAFSSALAISGISNDIYSKSRPSPPAIGAFDHNSLLPIELISFFGTCEESGRQLFWATSSEINNDYFTIEKSNDTFTWNFLSYVPGSGNSNHIKHYSFLDEEFSESPVYYRLKQTDYDGKTSEFQSISVVCNDEGPFDLNIFPNPASSIINASINSSEKDTGTIVLYNSFGQCLQKQQVKIEKGVNVVSLDIEELVKGPYLLEFICSGREPLFQKFIITR